MSDIHKVLCNAAMAVALPGDILDLSVFYFNPQA
jgi:hypothetical protein